jgi:hypothetical protein
LNSFANTKISGARAIALGGLLLFGMLGTPQAQVATPIEAPQFVVGESWQFSLQDTTNPSTPATVTNERVVAINGDGTVAIGTPRDATGHNVTLSASGNYIKRFGRSFDPDNAYLRFPLTLGSSWSTRFRWDSGSGSAGEQNSRNSVIGFEKVHVAAGDFETIKVEVIGQSRADGSLGVFSVYQQLWYAPAVKRVVLRKYRGTGFQYIETSQEELVAYHPAEPASTPAALSNAIPMVEAASGSVR